MKIREIFHFLRDTYTLVQQAGKMNIKKSGIFSRIGRIRRLVVRRLVAFGDWSHFRKFGDWSFGEWSFEDWSFGDWSFGEWSFGDWSVYPKAFCSFKFCCIWYPKWCIKLISFDKFVLFLVRDLRCPTVCFFFS
jgi:hypothetical protein